MNFSASDERVLGVEFTDDAFSVTVRDGRAISAPLVWYPRLLNASPAQRKNWKIAGGAESGIEGVTYRRGRGAWVPHYQSRKPVIQRWPGG